MTLKGCSCPLEGVRAVLTLEQIPLGAGEQRPAAGRRGKVPERLVEVDTAGVVRGRDAGYVVGFFEAITAKARLFFEHDPL